MRAKNLLLMEFISPILLTKVLGTAAMTGIFLMQ
jgi:hypothetical protein